MVKLSGFLVITIALAVAVTAPTAAHAAKPCHSGRVALTFDDGPDKYTHRFLATLEKHDAPATFFVMGFKARRTPALLRRMHRDGFVIANHSWDHPRLTSLTSKAVKRQLMSTNKAIKAAGVPRPTLMRPPYGLTSAAVRKVERSLHLNEVLWTIDTTDWNYRSRKYIVAAALDGLRPHHKNVILMHDGVFNSFHTAAAVPRIITRVREMGYCLTMIGPDGKPMNPLPRAVARAKTVVERNRKSTLRVPIDLASPAVATSTIRVRTVSRTARASSDFVPLDAVVTFKRGESRATVKVRLIGGTAHERTERFELHLRKAAGVTLSTRSVTITVKDNDPAA